MPIFSPGARRPPRALSPPAGTAQTIPPTESRITGKNPGGTAKLPSTFMYSYTFTRDQMGVGSASAVIMLVTIAAIMVGKPPLPAANV